VLPFIPLKSPSVEEGKLKYITSELKTIVEQPLNTTRYKKYDMKFEEGSPQEWIGIMMDLEDIWTQK
jgi:hypothetical protein